MKVKNVVPILVVTQSDIVAASQGIQGSVATYAALTSVSPASRAVGMWIVVNDESGNNPKGVGKGSLYGNDGVAYTFIAPYPAEADDLNTDTTAFLYVLSAADTDVQKALDSADAGFKRNTHSTGSDPVANNDGVDTASLGKRFRIGDSWHNSSTNHFFVATDVSTGAAVWREILTEKLEVIVDGNSAPITTGLKGYLEVPFDCIIVASRLLADTSTTTVVDVWKDTYANYPPTDADTITGGSEPTITAAVKAQDTTLSGWTTALTKGDILGFNVDSNNNANKLNIILDVIKI